MAAKGFESVQVLRGLAALLVILFHVGQAAEIPIGTWPMPGFVRGGSMGVDIFFCLSGFIMYLTAGESFGQPGATKRFLLRRLLRIYPLYWLASVLALLCGLAGFHVFDSHLESLPHTIKSFLLFPQSRNPVLGPGWTLVHEVRFYVTFGLTLMLARRRALACLWIWGLGSLAVLLFSHSFATWLGSTNAGRATNFIFHPSSIQFLLGVLAAWFVRGVPTRAGTDWMVLGIGIATTLFVLQCYTDLVVDRKYFNIALFTLPSFLLVLGAALFERRHGTRFPSLAVWMGDISYSTYLTHVLSITALVGISFDTHSGAHSPAYNLSICLLIAVAVHGISAVVYHAIELPLHERARIWAKRLGN